MSYGWAVTRFACLLLSSLMTISLPLVQTLTRPELRELARFSLSALPGRSDWVVPDYDAVTCYYAPSPVNVQALVTDPDWVNREQKGEPYINTASGAMVVGLESVEFLGGNTKKA